MGGDLESKANLEEGDSGVEGLGVNPEEKNIFRESRGVRRANKAEEMTQEGVAYHGKQGEQLRMGCRCSAHGYGQIEGIKATLLKSGV